MDDNKLIELVRKNSVLYDFTNARYVDTYFKQRVWNDIGQELKSDGKICRTRWNNIRDNYRKSIQKNIVRSHEGKKPTKPYRFHQQLAFLKKYLGDRNVTEKVDIGLDDEDANNDEAVTYDPLSSTVSSPVSGHTLSPEPTPTSSLLLNQTYHETVPKRSKHTKPPRPEPSISVQEYLLPHHDTYPHPVDTFLASLAPTLKNLHPCDWFDAKSELFSLVQKYEAKLLRAQFPLTVQTNNEDEGDTKSLRIFSNLSETLINIDQESLVNSRKNQNHIKISQESKRPTINKIESANIDDL